MHLNLIILSCSAGAVGQDQGIGDAGGPLTCYDPVTESYYAAGIISFNATTAGIGAPGQSVKIVNYLQWIANNTLAGDVFINSSTVVTEPTVATTTPLPTTTAISSPTIPALTTTPASTAPPITVTTPAGQIKACGLPGNGAVDPFGIVSQFPASLLKFGRRHFPGGSPLAEKRRLHSQARIIGGFDAPPGEICWQVKTL